MRSSQASRNGPKGCAPSDDRGHTSRLELVQLSHHNLPHLLHFGSWNLLRKVLPQSERNPDPTIAQSFVADLLTTRPRGLTRLLFDLDDLRLLLDVIPLDSIVDPEVV